MEAGQLLVKPMSEAVAAEVERVASDSFPTWDLPKEDKCHVTGSHSRATASTSPVPAGRLTATHTGLSDGCSFCHGYLWQEGKVGH